MPTLHDSPHALATLDDAGIGTLRLREAGRLNIVGSAAIAELRAALQGLATEPALRVLRSTCSRPSIHEPSIAGAMKSQLSCTVSM